MSADGRYVAFRSSSSDLVPGDTNATSDIFVRDRLNGTTERLSLSSAKAQANGVSGIFGISISADGRFVAFESRANNLVPGDTNLNSDVFVRDRSDGTTERVSVGVGGVQGNSESSYPSISADGSCVAFMSRATNLVPGDNNGVYDVYLRDRLNGTTERISVGIGGADANSESSYTSISADARYVAFASGATNLVPGDTNGFIDIFVRDRLSGTTERVSITTLGAQPNFDSRPPAISADGRCVAFQSRATNIVPGDTNATADVFLRDRQSGTTELVSVTAGGVPGNFSSGLPHISGDGRYVSFDSLASNLVPGDTNGFIDVFVRDRLSGVTERVNLATGGAQTIYQNSGHSSISTDGRYVAFKSYSRDLVPGDSNGEGDVFLHDRDAAGFTSVCDPGLGGVIACPCSNPPSGPGRGCDNSSATGGALLSASGIAYLSMDSLVLTTSGENPAAASIVVQGNASIASGAVFGQGARCGGGMLKRLYLKTASAGAITAPDFAAGDPTVSARSATLGDPIQPGESRWYFVYYRDSIVLGGCPPTSSFNSTQTGHVAWWP